MVAYKAYDVLLRIEFKSETRGIAKEAEIWEWVIAESIFDQNKALVILLLDQVELCWSHFHVASIRLI